MDFSGAREAVQVGLLVGAVGESLEVLELGSAEFSVRLAPATGDGLDLARFEATMPAPCLLPPASSYSAGAGDEPGRGGDLTPPAATRMD